MISRRSMTFALAAITLLSANTVAAQLTANFDHLKCYKVKDFGPKKLYKADLIPEQHPPFPLEPGCKIIASAKLFCIDVVKTNVQPNPPGAPAGPKTNDFLCYKIACPKQVLPTTLVVSDQFGTRDIAIKPPKFLCAPARKQLILHPTPSPTATQTPAPTPTRTPGCDFGSTTGKCGGPCPPTTAGVAQQCVFVVNSDGTADCDCRPPNPSCTLPAGSNQCAGPCPDPRDQCQNGLPGEPPCVCAHPCSLDHTGTPQCSGDCQNPSEVCTLNAAGGCNCQPPSGNPPCGNTMAPQCDGGCPNPGEACVPGGPIPGGCFCENGTPPPCGQLQGNPQCLGACPANLACVTVGPVPGGNCACQ